PRQRTAAPGHRSTDNRYLSIQDSRVVPTLAVTTEMCILSSLRQAGASSPHTSGGWDAAAASLGSDDVRAARRNELVRLRLDGPCTNPHGTVHPIAHSDEVGGGERKEGSSKEGSKGSSSEEGGPEGTGQKGREAGGEEGG